MFSDADAVALYDLLNPWDGQTIPSDAFYDSWVMASPAVLDVGCGPGAMLCQARAAGHTGRLVGLDPDPAALRRAAAKCASVEWVLGTAAQVRWRQEFDLVTMVSHTFQLLVSDEELDASLHAIAGALAPGGRFVFETRDPRAREWEEWHADNPVDVVDEHGRLYRVVYEVDEVTGDDGQAGGVNVTFTQTTIDWVPGDVVHIERTTLRFLDEAGLDERLARAGFTVEERYGDWDRSPVTGSSREIITVARRA